MYDLEQIIKKFTNSHSYNNQWTMDLSDLYYFKLLDICSNFCEPVDN